MTPSKSRLLNLLEVYIDITGKLLTKTKNIEEPIQKNKILFQNFLRRNYYVTKSTHKLLIEYFLKDENYNFSICILLRVGVLDFLCVAYFDKEIRKGRNPEDIIAELNEEFVKKEHNNKNGNKETADILYKLFPENFILKEENSFPKRKENVREIKASKIINDYKYKELETAYQLYNYFSQYEHYSSFSSMLFINSKEERDIKFDTLFYYLLEGFEYTILCSYFCFYELDDSKELILILDDCLKTLKELKNEIFTK